MYLLRLFLMGWFSAGIVTVFFPYWLCSRTAAPLKEGKLSTFPDQRSGTDNQSHEVRAA